MYSWVEKILTNKTVSDFATPDRSTAVRRAITTPPPTSAGICGRSDALVQTADVSDTKMLTFKSEVNRSSEEMIVRP